MRLEKRNAVQETLNGKEIKCMELKDAFLLVGCQFDGESQKLLFYAQTFYK